MYFEMLYYTGSYDTDGGFTARQVRIEEEVVKQLLSEKPPTFIKVMIDEGQTITHILGVFLFINIEYTFYKAISDWNMMLYL